jgi:hypothetical protein
MGDSAIAQAKAANASTVKLPQSSVSLLYSHISSHLVATITALDSTKEDLPALGDGIVKGLFVDGDQNIESQWQTPFENSNPEQKLPTLMAGLQSGQISDVMGSLSEKIKKASSTAAEILDPVTGYLQSKAESVRGKTNLTKVNTKQIFLSTASIRLNLTLAFIAIKDPKVEVENQISLLQQWALPVSLADDGLIGGSIKQGSLDPFPSTIPPFVSLTLHGKTYKPLIIESVQAPLNVPIDSNGNRLSAQVQINLMSLTAWDKQDIINLYGGSK